MNIVLDFLVGYNEQLVIDLDKISIKTKTIQLDNARNGNLTELIVKAVYSFN